MNRFAVAIAGMVVTIGSAQAHLHAGVAAVFSGPLSNTTCAWLADDAVQCIGSLTGAFTAPTMIHGLTSMSLSAEFGCYSAQSKVYCWGHTNTYGQLGDGTTAPHDLPAPVQFGGTDFTDVESVSVGALHACAVKTDQTLWCWGDGWQGQLGNYYTHAASSTPVQVTFYNGSSVTPASAIGRVSLGAIHSCLQRAGFSAYAMCWGYNDDGELGDANTMSTNYPVGVGGFTTYVGDSLNVGLYHACAKRQSDGALMCWGMNDDNQLGNFSGVTNSAGTKFNPNPSFVVRADGTVVTNANLLTLGAKFGCFTFGLDDNVQCWGSNYEEQLGSGAGSSSAIPVTIKNYDGSELADVWQLALGYAHACVLVSGSTVKCWGANEAGQVGHNGFTQLSSALAVHDFDAPIFSDRFDD